MGAIGQYQVVPFGSPAGSLDPTNLANQTRGNDNVTVSAFNKHDADSSIHTVGRTTSGVSSATAIAATITGMAFGAVQGTDGTNTFVDLVAWNGTTNVKGVIASTTVDGSPAARTYSVAAGALKVAMGSGTYTITLVPIAF